MTASNTTIPPQISILRDGTIATSTGARFCCCFRRCSDIISFRSIHFYITASRHNIQRRGQNIEFFAMQREHLAIHHDIHGGPPLELPTMHRPPPPPPAPPPPPPPHRP